MVAVAVGVGVAVLVRVRVRVGVAVVVVVWVAVVVGVAAVVVVVVMEINKLPPHAPDMEQAVLGAAMLAGEGNVSEVGGFLKSEHFYVSAHQRIWRAIARLYDRGDPIDILTVIEELRKSGDLEDSGGAYYIGQLTNMVASDAHIQYHARIIVQYFVQREVIRLSEEMKRDGYDMSSDAFELAERAQKTVSDLMDEVMRRTGSSIGAVADEELARMDEPQRRHVSTGLHRLDDALSGGWSPGDLIMLAGRPGMGKTACALSMCYSSARNGVPVGLFSLEMSAHKVNARFQSIGTSIPLSSILSPSHLTEQQINLLHAHHSTYSRLPIEVNFCNGITMTELKAEAYRWVRRKGVKVIYIDQLSWVSTKARDPVERVGEVTRGIKKIAVDLEVPIVLLHQLSRDVARRDDKRPMLTDMRDSGHAEQDAQVVVFAHRDDYYGVAQGADWDGAIDLIIAKNSNGPLSDVRMYFDAPCTAVREHGA